MCSIITAIILQRICVLSSVGKCLYCGFCSVTVVQNVSAFQMFIRLNNDMIDNSVFCLYRTKIQH